METTVTEERSGLAAVSAAENQTFIISRYYIAIRKSANGETPTGGLSQSQRCPMLTNLNLPLIFYALQFGLQRNSGQQKWNCCFFKLQQNKLTHV